MQRFYETVFDTLTGAAVKGAEVWVWNAADNSLAALFSNNVGATTSNPLISDSNGFVECFVADGLYNIEFRWGGASMRTIEGVSLFDLAIMRSDLDAVIASDALKPTKVYVDNQDAAIMAAYQAADATLAGEIANTYTKAQVDALIAGAGGSSAWGSITGLLANQVDLSTALAAKMAKASNLSDLANIGTSRTNLSVYSKAEVDAAIAAAAGAGGIEIPFTTPGTAGFTNLNFGAGTTFTATAKGVLVKDTTGGTNIRGVLKAPDPTNWTCIMRLHRMRMDGGSGYQAVAIVSNSTSGRLMILGETAATNYALQAWTSVTALSGSAIAIQAADIANFPWHKIQRIGNELDWYVSVDGENWGTVLIGNITTGWAPSNFLNAAGGNIDGVGFGLLAPGATVASPLGTTCCSFQLTTP